MTRSRIQTDKDERIVIEFDDTTRAWNDWKHGNIIHKSSVHDRYVVSLGECTKMYMTHKTSSIPFESIEIPSLVKTIPQIDVNCHVCHKYQNQLYPCRTCGKVYHQQCIKDIADTRSYHLIPNALNLIGWSCPNCEDLRMLLSTEELTETNEWMKSVDKQSIFNLDFYINTRIKSKSSVSFDFAEFNNRMKTILRIFLHTIADMTSNFLSQADLFLLDISMKIVRTSPKFLVNALTSFELYRLSQLFISLSTIENSSISYNKFHQVFNSYLLTAIPELNSDDKHAHLEALAHSLLGNQIEFDQTWSQFILDATIPTLLNRYNHRTPIDLVSRIVSVRHSTSPSTDDLTKYEGEQSLTAFINNILQKLTQTTGANSKPMRTKNTKMKKRTNERFIRR